MPPTSEKPLQYQWLDGRIHEFVLMDFTRAGVDEFVAKIDEINHSDRLGAPILVDSSRGLMPLSYMLKRFQALYRTAPRAPQRYKIALIMQSGFLATVLENMIRMFPQMNLQIFGARDRHAALEWLRQVEK